MQSSPTTPEAVRFRGVTRRFGDVRALDAVDVSISTGETVAVLGPNGAGKTTAIGLILGLTAPTAGSVETLGQSPSSAVSSGRVGAMLQASGLPSYVRVAELLEFTRRLYPEPLALSAILERAGLTPLRDRRIDQISGGEAQRLRFAMAIAGNPDLVILDEPTVAMDVETRRSFWADMRRSASEGRTILFATHYLEEADQVADRVLVLDRGTIVADGSGSAIRGRVHARTIRFDLPGADAEMLAGVAGVTAMDIHGDQVKLTSNDADETVHSIYAAGLAVRNIEVTGAGLEEAFLALTDPDRSQTETNR
jgi:ABC-2 type transport system ATP-binding protein